MYFFPLMKNTIWSFCNSFHWYFEFIFGKLIKFLNKFVRVVLISITKWNFNQDESFRSLNKLGIIIYMNLLNCSLI